MQAIAVKKKKRQKDKNARGRNYQCAIGQSRETYYMGWKVPGFLMKTSVFWAKLYLFLNIVAFEDDTLGSDFPTFRCPFCSMKRPSLRNTPRFPRWLPHSMWISFLGATAWGLGTDNSRWRLSLENTMGEQSIRIVIGPIWSIAFKDVCDGALSWWCRTKAKVAPLKRL